MTDQHGEGILTRAARRELLTIARAALTDHITTGRIPNPAAASRELQIRQGMFVTLTIGGNLRGCMGHFDNDTPIAELAARQAVVSATHDPRFARVQPQELAAISIEISVLSNPEPVPSWRDIVVGTHGVIIEKSGRRATFLPQVAPEQGWDRDTMLSHLAVKAGLTPGAWREGASFKVYTAQVFGEKDFQIETGE